MAQRHRFTVILEQEKDGSVAGFGVPFSVPEVFGTRGRVPVCGTINGFPFRSSLSPMGGRHLMPVNRELRVGAGVRAMRWKSFYSVTTHHV